MVKNNPLFPFPYSYVYGAESINIAVGSFWPSIVPRNIPTPTANKSVFSSIISEALGFRTTSIFFSFWKEYLS